MSVTHSTNEQLLPNSAANGLRVDSAGGILSYEQRLSQNPRWALSEGSKFFDEKSAVQDTMRKIAHRLDELGIAYAVAEGMANFAHGYRRFTEDVDILVTREGRKTIHQKLAGLGYVPPFTGSKNLLDAETGVRIEFLTAGEFPGDGKPKPVAFPDPASQCVEIGGIKYVNLPTLIEMKLASGMTNTERIKDLGDVQEIIKTLTLPAEFAEKLNRYVREKYLELWHSVCAVRKRYLRIWRNKYLTPSAQSIDDMIAILQRAVDTLKAMRDDGVILDPDGGTGDDDAYLVTYDPNIAKKYDMHDESEFWEEAEEKDDPGGDDAV